MKPIPNRLIVIAAVAALAACGKAQEKASEKITEKMIESAIEKDGSKAKVDLSGGGYKVSTTDASGKTSQVEMGTVQVSEADLTDMTGNDGTAMFMLNDEQARSVLQVHVVKAEKGTDIQIVAQRTPAK